MDVREAKREGRIDIEEEEENWVKGEINKERGERKVVVGEGICDREGQGERDEDKECMEKGKKLKV